MSEKHPKHLGKIFLAAIIAIALAIAIPFLPWIRPEVVEGATIIKLEGSGCVVETESKSIRKISNCGEKGMGDRVTVKYRSMTSVGELMP